MMLPSSVKAFFDELENEVEVVCGQRYSREAGVSWYGAQPGSIILGNQRISVRRPRVRGPEREVPLTTYARFQDPSIFDSQVFEQGLKHVSQRDYEKGLPQIAASFGVNKSTVSRSWVKSTRKHRKQVEKLLKRDLGPLGIVVVFIDGKRFSKLGVVVTLGVGADGRKHVLGIYQSSTENSAACISLLNDLETRGLAERDLLFIVDGGSGLAIHRLKIGAQLKKFFSSTNPIESLNSLLEEDLRRVKRWRDSEHFQRWLASACLTNEKRMRRIRGYRGLPSLKVRLQELCKVQETVDNETNVA